LLLLLFSEALMPHVCSCSVVSNPDRRDIADEVIEELTVHARIEEKVFWPAARKAAPETTDHTLEGIEEHHAVVWMLSELKDMDPSDGLASAWAVHREPWLLRRGQWCPGPCRGGPDAPLSRGLYASGRGPPQRRPFVRSAWAPTAGARLVGVHAGERGVVLGAAGALGTAPWTGVVHTLLGRIALLFAASAVMTDGIAGDLSRLLFGDPTSLAGR
jgi:hypothetical protein